MSVKEAYVENDKTDSDYYGLISTCSIYNTFTEVSLSGVCWSRIPTHCVYIEASILSVHSFNNSATILNQMTMLYVWRHCILNINNEFSDLVNA